MVRIERVGVAGVERERSTGVEALSTAGRVVAAGLVDGGPPAVAGLPVFFGAPVEGVREAWRERRVRSVSSRKASSDIEPAYSLNKTFGSLASFYRRCARS